MPHNGETVMHLIGSIARRPGLVSMTLGTVAMVVSFFAPQWAQLLVFHLGLVALVAPIAWAAAVEYSARVAFEAIAVIGGIGIILSAAHYDGNVFPQYAGMVVLLVGFTLVAAVILGRAWYPGRTGQTCQVIDRQ